MKKSRKAGSAVRPNPGKAIYGNAEMLLVSTGTPLPPWSPRINELADFGSGLRLRSRPLNASN
jgi:hypothetical protein